ncbi:MULTISPECIES: hypothetical protein [Segatella]|jgi:hypothetical protein|nr:MULTISPECIES: hypothetical protein [Segatella]MBQ3857218.1 phage holin family protein [Prevotella sp.]MDR4929920.1 phage holin family protein [Segatella bryantii]MEE3413950.1 phage holin family protein [Prevotella sp.]OYP57384.1 hypothetical protein CIK91_00510 [Segatella bryantii]UKK73245.1 phage holin family protein [Segatella bryantii]
MFSNDQNIETIGQLVEVLKHYIGLQKEYVMLDVVDKIVRLLTATAIAVSIILLLLISLIYISFAAAFAIAPHTGMAGAFAIIGAIYLFFLLLVVLFRQRWIEKPLVHFLAGILLENNNNEL